METRKATGDIHMNKEEALKQYEIYSKRIKVLGVQPIFEFEICNDYIRVSDIIKEDVEEVIIPEFVYGVRTGIFYRSKHIRKVSTKGNLHGSMDSMFREVNTPTLDLTEFNFNGATSLISTFQECRIGELKIGRIEIHDNCLMTRLFNRAKIRNLTIDSVIARNDARIGLESLFEMCSIQNINIKRMYIRNVDTLGYAFRGAKIGGAVDISEIRTKNVYMPDMINWPSIRLIVTKEQIEHIEDGVGYKPTVVKKVGANEYLATRWISSI